MPPKAHLPKRLADPSTTTTMPSKRVTTRSMTSTSLRPQTSTTTGSASTAKSTVKMPKNVASNLAAAAAVSSSAETKGEQKGKGEDEGPMYFWRPHERYGYMGQWYESEWEVDGATYATAEMWMMVGKARLFGDEDIARQILSTTDPKLHRALGRQVERFDEKVWNKEKYRIVVEGNYLKFTKSKDADELRKMLLATGDRELVEASPRDRIWGIGFGEKNAGKNRYRWGLNLLGKALMDVRKRLREEDTETEKKQGEVTGQS
ncbi:DUF1768-domain-containing protein [Aaosphaeria arxii CBS 175.79]|uniref:DUF1768-domain-containing protein n=1 Tax=Aaosphaeria arxii CBS 175.79 TaxID=1450172 RepID=A0A6A5XTB1_9PLEO|nr:DUF1768-domain-containing protein [Aaosphaeria arxii CBS 175.79]KAF2016183.1 DUF1768-domain-containing protein [Aaosphaeria arxii CBS 175.79]